MFRDEDLAEVMDIRPREEKDTHGEKVLGGVATSSLFFKLAQSYPLGLTLMCFAFASDSTEAGSFSDKVWILHQSGSIKY